MLDGKVSTEPALRRLSARRQTIAQFMTSTSGELADLSSSCDFADNNKDRDYQLRANKHTRQGIEYVPHAPDVKRLVS